MSQSEFFENRSKLAVGFKELLMQKKYVKKVWEEECKLFSKEYFDEKYGSKINLDEIDVWAERNSNSLNTISYIFHYGNLYSFCVCHGVVVPYNEWIYEKLYQPNGGKRKFIWNEKQKTGKFKWK